MTATAIEEDEDGLLYAVPIELGAAAPPVRRLPATAAEVHDAVAEVVPADVWLADLAAGRGRAAFQAHVYAGPVALARALAPLLAALDTRGPDARDWLAALVLGAPEPLRAALAEALELAQLRRDDAWDEDAPPPAEPGAAAARADLHRFLASIGLPPSADGHDVRTSVPHAVTLLFTDTHASASHAAVLRGWAALDAGLAEVSYDELPGRAEDEPDAGDGRLVGLHRVRAYFDGRGVEVRVPADAGRLDLAGLLGLANLVLERRGRGARMAVLEGFAEGAWLLAAPAPALRALAAAGLRDP